MNLEQTHQSHLQNKRQRKNYNHTFCNLAKRFLSQEKSLPIITYIYGDPPNELNYPVKGSDMWDNVIREENYYMYKNEVDLINKSAHEIKKYISEKPVIIDLGPGSLKSVQDKTLPLLNTLETIKSYVPVDISDTALREAKAIIKSQYPLVRVTPVKADFYNYHSSFSYYNDLVAYCMGSTICNTPEDYDANVPVNTIKDLRKLRDITGNSGTLVISHDANQDVESLMRAYDNPSLHNAFLYLLHRMNWELPIQGLDVENFECIVKWNPKHYRMSYHAKAKEAATVTLDGEKFYIPQNAELHIGNSYKYPVHVFRQIAKAAGFTPIKHFQDDEGKMVIHILKAKEIDRANTA